MSGRLLAGIAMFLTAGVCVFAHDEDWRKYADREGAVEGPIWVNEAARDGADAARSSSPFPASGVTVMSQVPVNNIGSGGDGSDCWGYTSASGREYALMCVETGLGVVEVTDPYDPQVIGFVPSATSIWHDVKTIGDYAYAVNESGNGIQVIDLSDVDNGNVRFVRDVTQGGHFTTHNIVANEETGYLYLTGANVANGGLVAVDVNSDPENPTFAGSWNTRYVHDAQVVNMEVGPYAGREIAFCFNGGAGVDIVDVTDKSNMTRVGGLSYSGIRYTHQGWVSDDQQYLYLNDELDEGSTVSVTTTRVVRIHDPDYSGPASGRPSLENPQFVGTFTTGLPAIDHNLYVKNGVIYQANYRSGLRIFDATADAANPTEIGFVDTYPTNDNASFNGAWSVYPYFESGTVLVSDIERGLFAVRVDVGPDAQSLILDIVSDTPPLLPAGEPIEVVAEVEENGTEPDADGYRVEVSVNGGATQEVPMSATGVAGRFSAMIGGFECFDEVRFRVVATSTEGGRFQSSERSFTVADEEFLLAEGEDPTVPFTTNSTATAGFWEFGAPAAGDRGDPPSDSDGTGLAWLTQRAAGNTDVDNGVVSLTTEPYDLSDGGVVVFDYWFNDVSTGPLSASDYFRVEVSQGGDAFVLLREYTSAAGSWRADEITFGDGGELPASSDVKLRFSVSDLGDQNIVEGGVDGLRVLRYECDPPAACPADIDGNNAVDLGDLLAVLGAFGDAGGDADIDGDGAVDLDDLLTVLSEFGTAC